MCWPTRISWNVIDVLLKSGGEGVGSPTFKIHRIDSAHTQTWNPTSYAEPLAFVAIILFDSIVSGERLQTKHPHAPHRVRGLKTLFFKIAGPVCFADVATVCDFDTCILDISTYFCLRRLIKCCDKRIMCTFHMIYPFVYHYLPTHFPMLKGRASIKLLVKQRWFL